MDREECERLAPYLILGPEYMGRELAEYQDELDEFGKFDEDGGTLSRADFEDVRGM